MGMTQDPLVSTIFIFSVYFEDSVGSVSGLGSGIFGPIGVNSKCDIFALVMFVPIGVKSKGGRIIESFWRSNSFFPPKFENQFYTYIPSLTSPH